MKLKVKYFSDKIEKLKKIEKGDWIDLRSTVDVHLMPGDSMYIPLGIGMILPDGFEAHVVPRSSTFKKWGIIQTNSIGVIDNSYSGEKDQWMMPVYASRETDIHVGDRICQFRIMEVMPELEIEEVEHLNDKSRGGFGSTGKN